MTDGRKLYILQMMNDDTDFAFVVNVIMH